MRKIQVICSVVLIYISISYCEENVSAILKALEQNMSIESDVSAKVTLTQYKVDQGSKKMVAMYFRKDSDNSILMYFIAPEADKGNGYLRVDENWWMYRRNTRTFQHIGRDENIGGSNLHSDDFEYKKLTSLYSGLVTHSGKDSINLDTIGGIPTYKFPVQAIVTDVSYSKKKLWVNIKNNLQIKEECFSSTGTLMQTNYYLKYAPIANRYLSVKQIGVDEVEKGNKTLMEVSDISTNKIEKYVFTKAHLENISK